MKSAKKNQPVTDLVPMLGNTFAMTRNAGELRVRKLAKPKAKDGRQLVLPFPERSR